MATAAPKFKVGQRVGMLSWHMDGTAWRQRVLRAERSRA